MKVRELFSDESKWTQGGMARDSAGIRVPARSSAAISWSLLGAIQKCYDGLHEQMKVACMCYPTVPCIGTDHVDDVYRWNDAPERTFAEVKALVEELNI